MSVFGYKKIGDKERADEIEKLDKKNIAIITTEGKKCLPIAIMYDGNVYYLAHCAEDYKKGFEKFENQFLSADRVLIVNMDHVSHYEKDFNRMHFFNEAIPIVPVAFSYIKRVCEKLNRREARKKQ